MLRVFIGYDPRSALAYNVLQHSIVRHASKPVAIIPLILNQLPMKRCGLTQFTYSRFLVPYLCEFQGVAIFMDADMIVTGDIHELASYAEPDKYAVQVVKNQPRFEWPSMMLFNNQNCKTLSLENVDSDTFSPFKFEWGDVGDLPEEWNYCVGYKEPVASKLYHYTQGIPHWKETNDCFGAELWHKEKEAMLDTCEWEDLMGKSVHAQPVIMRLLKRYGQMVDVANN